MLHALGTASAVLETNADYQGLFRCKDVDKSGAERA